MTSKNQADFSTGTAESHIKSLQGIANSPHFHTVPSLLWVFFDRCATFKMTQRHQKLPEVRTAVGNWNRMRLRTETPHYGSPAAGKTKFSALLWYQPRPGLSPLSLLQTTGYMGPQLCFHAHMLSAFIMCMCQIKYLSRTCCWLPTQTQQQHATSAPWPLKSAWRLKPLECAGRGRNTQSYRC